MHIVGPGGSISAISHSRDDTERLGAGSQAWLTTVAGTDTAAPTTQRELPCPTPCSPTSRNTKYPWMTRIPTRCFRSASARHLPRPQLCRQPRVDAGSTGQRADDIRNRLHLCGSELVDNRRHRTFDDRRRRRPASAGSLMLDVESGGNPAGDGSSWINGLYWDLADYAGSSVRISG